MPTLSKKVAAIASHKPGDWRAWRRNRHGADLRLARPTSQSSASSRAPVPFARPLPISQPLSAAFDPALALALLPPPPLSAPVTPVSAPPFALGIAPPVMPFVT